MQNAEGLLSAIQPCKKSETIWSIVWVRFFPGDNFWMKADAVAFCVERWSARAGCYVLTLSHSFIVQLVTCEVWFSQLVTKFPCTVDCQACKTTPAQPCLSCRLTAPNPPSTPTPLQLQSCSERDPTQNLEEEIRWCLFLCCSLTPSLSLYIRCQSVNTEADCMHNHEQK